MPRSQACIAGFPATTPVCSIPISRPAKSVTTPPPPRMMQHARRDVPGRQPLLPEPVEAARGHVGQVERGGARPADAAGGRRDPGELAGGTPPAGIVPERKPGADQRERRARRSSRPPAAARPARRRHRETQCTSRCGAPGPPRPPRERRPPPRRSRPRTREVVEKVGGAVQRIDHPHQPSVTTSGLSSSPMIRLPGSAASRISAIIRSAVRSTSVTKSRLPLWVQPAGSAGRSTAADIPAPRARPRSWPDAVSPRKTLSCVPNGAG